MHDSAFLRRVIAAGERLATNRAAVIVVAIERFKRAHGGALPPSLDALVPDYLDTIPEDPFDGQILRFAQSDGSYTVYSVGIDQRDDGGKTGSWIPDVRYYGSMGATTPDPGIQVPRRALE